MSKEITTAARHFGDGDLAESKAQHVLEWVKRRIKEFPIETSSTIGHDPEGAPLEVLGDRGHLVRALFGTDEETIDEDQLDSLRVEVVLGGATNVSARVWSVLVESTLTDPQCIFVKICFPYARWAKDKRPCPIERSSREFEAFKLLDDVCPNVTSTPVMCGPDEVVQDGTRYLLIEHLPLHFEKYVFQFQRGTVDIRPAQALGFTLAKLHVQAPRRFHGRDGILNLGLQRATVGFFARIEFDLKAYLEHGDFLGVANCNKKFWVPVSNPIVAQKFLCQLRDQPEILRAVSRHMDNFLNPPNQTATMICVDSHVINILVSSLPSSYPYSYHQEEYAPGFHNVMKLIDLEFYNWGPSGADLGLFIASAFFYALVHSYSEDAVARSNVIIQAIAESWNAYRESYIRHARQEKTRTDDSIPISLYRIVHEILGWAGVWICRFASPSLYPRVSLSEMLYPPPCGFLDLERRVSPDTGETGLELVRDVTFALAASCLILGFGDETCERFHHANERGGCTTGWSIEACNQVMNKFLKDLTTERDKLYSLIRKSRPPE